MSDGRSRFPTGVHAVIAAIAITAGLGAVGVAAARTAADEYTIEGIAADAEWHPADLTIQTGDRVTWTFEQGSFHNVESSGPNWSFTSGSPPSVDPASYTFASPGEYDYVCIVHPGMTGTVTVRDEPAPTATATPTVTPTATPTATPTPSPTPTANAQQAGGGPVATPPPSGRGDAIAPAVRSVRLTARRRALRVRFRLSEPATVTVRVRRRGARRALASARVQARAGTRTVTLRSRRLRRGRYVVQIRARDAFGNRSGLITRRLTLRGS